MEPTYRIAFGDFKAGQLLDPATMTATQVEFPDGVFAMTAKLSRERTWNVAPSH